MSISALPLSNVLSIVSTSALCLPSLVPLFPTVIVTFISQRNFILVMLPSASVLIKADIINHHLKKNITRLPAFGPGLLGTWLHFLSTSSRWSAGTWDLVVPSGGSGAGSTDPMVGEQPSLQWVGVSPAYLLNLRIRNKKQLSYPNDSPADVLLLWCGGNPDSVFFHKATASQMETCRSVTFCPGVWFCDPQWNETNVHECSILDSA